MRKFRIEERHIIIDDSDSGLSWANEADEDGKNPIFGFDISAEIISALIGELDKKFTLTNEESVYITKELSEHFNK